MTRLKLLAVWIVCLCAAVFGLLRMLYAIFINPQKAWLLAISFDRLANCATNGSLNETLSTRANRSRSEGRRWGCLMCGFLDRIDKDHCAKSQELERGL